MTCFKQKSDTVKFTLERLLIVIVLENGFERSKWAFVLVSEIGESELRWWRWGKRTE